MQSLSQISVANISALSSGFYRLDVFPVAQSTVSKALKTFWSVFDQMKIFH